MRAYIERFKFKSITTPEWKAHLLDYFTASEHEKHAVAQIDFDAWLMGTGLPPTRVSLNTTLSDAAVVLATRWCAATVAEGVATGFSGSELVSALPSPAPNLLFLPCVLLSSFVGLLHFRSKANISGRSFDTTQSSQD